MVIFVFFKFNGVGGYGVWSYVMVGNLVIVL